MALPTILFADSIDTGFTSTITIPAVACGSGPDRVALALVCNYHDTTFLPGNATLGGVTMTKGSVVTSGYIGGKYTSYWLNRSSMPSGSQNFVVDLSSGSGVCKGWAIILVYDNVGADVGGPTTKDGQSLNGPHVAVSTAAGHKVAAMFAYPSAYSIVGQGGAVAQHEHDYATSFTAGVLDEVAASGTLDVNGLLTSALGFMPGWFASGWDLSPTSTAATTVTLSGPTSGNVGAASSAFTVGLDGTPTGTISVTPSDGGAGGSFSPSSVSLSSSSITATFSYTPTTSGARTVTTSNNGGLSNQSIGYTANATAPAVVTQPTNQSVVAGQQATFTAAFSGVPTPTLQWQRDAAGGGSWVDIPGATSASFTTPATTVTGGSWNNTDQIRCLGTNVAGANVATTAAVLTVTASGDAVSPTWPASPSISTSGVTSSSFTFSCPTATDNVAVTSYEYSINGGTTWVPNGLATSKTINTGVVPGQVYQLRWRCKDAAGNTSPELTGAVTATNTSATIGPFHSGGGTPWPVGTVINYSYFPGGRIGALSGITPVEGSASVIAGNVITVAGWPVGSGVVHASKRHATDANLDMTYEQPVTVA